MPPMSVELRQDCPSHAVRAPCAELSGQYLDVQAAVLWPGCEELVGISPNCLRRLRETGESNHQGCAHGPHQCCPAPTLRPHRENNPKPSQADPGVSKLQPCQLRHVATSFSRVLLHCRAPKPCRCCPSHDGRCQANAKHWHSGHLWPERLPARSEHLSDALRAAGQRQRAAEPPRAGGHPSASLQAPVLWSNGRWRQRTCLRHADCDLQRCEGRCRPAARQVPWEEQPSSCLAPCRKNPYHESAA
mmetsp:Transcript_134424/g.233658  ORF Transcript_134424/g.233658 Transcript_134424/m.233658 type:complete len:246 (-) Transcript_134424:356-1093(-)